MLTPSMALVAGLPQIRLEELLLLATLGYLIMAALSGLRIRLAWGLRQTLLASFVVFIFISIGVGLSLGYGGALSDLNQLVRILKYLIIYTLAITVVAFSDTPEQTKLKILKFILALSVLLFMIAVQQYFDLGGLNRLYVQAVAPVHYDALGGSNPRVVGMVGNPNELGFLFVLTGLIAVHLLTRRFHIVYALLIAMSLFGIGLTASRTSLVVFVFGVVLLLVLALLQLSRMWLSSAIQGLAVIMLLIVAVSTTLAEASFMDRLLWRFEELGDPAEASSWKGRVVRWQDNLAIFRESPIFGVGPLRRMEMAAVDNEWLLLARSYGVIGTMALVLAMVLPHWRSARTPTKVLGTGVMAASAVYMIPAAVFHSLVLMPLVLIILALSETTLSRKVRL
jgi:O-antigen ligase